MAKSILACAGTNGSTINAGSLWHASLFGICEDDGNGIGPTIEIPYDGKIGGLSVIVASNTLSGALTAHLRLYRNIVESALTLEVAAAGTGIYSDTTTARQVYAGERLSFGISAESGTGSAEVRGILAWYLPDDSGVTVTLQGINAPGSVNLQAADQVEYFAINGFVGNSANESGVDQYAFLAGTAFKPFMSSGNVARSTDAHFVLRKNGVDTVVDLTVNTSSTLHVDNVNAPSIAVGDRMSWKFTAGSDTGNLNHEKSGYWLKPSTSDILLASGFSPNGQTLNANTTYYINIIGSVGALGITESDAEIEILPDCDMDVSRFFVELGDNGVSADSTLTLRKNGSDVATLTLTASTGNTTYTVDPGSLSYVTGDTICAKLVTGSTGTNIRIRQIGVIADITDSGLPATIDYPTASHIQDYTAAAGSGTSSLTAVIDDTTGQLPETATNTNQGPRAGNFLVAAFTFRGTASGFTNPTGWDFRASNDASGNVGNYICTRIATSGNNDCALSWSTGTPTVSCVVREYDVLDESTPFHSIAEDISAQSASGGASFNTGSVTPPAGTTIIVSSGHGYNRSDWASDDSLTQMTPPTGFVDIRARSTGASRPLTMTVDKIGVDQSPVNPSWSTTNAGGRVIGATLVIQAATLGDEPVVADPLVNVISSGGFVQGVPWIIQGGTFVKATEVHIISGGVFVESAE